MLSTLERRVQTGTNALEIDRWTAQMVADEGATSCCVDDAPSFGRR